MYARLSIFENLDLDFEQQAREWTSTEGLRLSRELPGHRGLLTLLDRDTGRLVGIGLYDGEENLRKADEIMNGPLPVSTPDELKRAAANRTFVGLFEVIERDGV